MSEMDRFFGDPNIAKLSWLLGSKTSPAAAKAKTSNGVSSGTGAGSQNGSYYGRRR